MLYIVACSDMYGLCGQIYNGKILDTGRIRIQSTHIKYAHKVCIRIYVGIYFHADSRGDIGDMGWEVMVTRPPTRNARFPLF